VLDLACGRGELLELLTAAGVEASGVEPDAELVKAAAERGLAVEQGDAARSLAATPGSLGGIALLRAVEALAAQDLLDVVGLAAEKLRPGGKVVVLGTNPGSALAQARAARDPAWVRPVHPAYLTFLLREAGFPEVAVDWWPPSAGEAAAGEYVVTGIR
jgi:O-antigen chain-terminating methyltransferase